MKSHRSTIAAVSDMQMSWEISEPQVLRGKIDGDYYELVQLNGRLATCPSRILSTIASISTIG
jgi:hypothetical protein